MTGELSELPVRTSARKWARILRALANGRHLTRFDAEGLGDHSLNSTIAYLQQKKGIHIARVPVVVPSRFGEVHCLRYHLEDDQRERAMSVLAGGA